MVMAGVLEWRLPPGVPQKDCETVRGHVVRSGTQPRHLSHPETALAPHAGMAADSSGDRGARPRRYVQTAALAVVAGASDRAAALLHDRHAGRAQDRRQ